MRVAAISRSDIRFTTVRPLTGTFSCLSPIALLPVFEFFDNYVQPIETGIPELAVLLDPFRLLLEAADAEPACAHAPDLFRGDQTRLFEDADKIGRAHV